MGELLPWRASARVRTGRLGMILFIASWAMMFTALFFAYGTLRLRAVVWPPLDAPPLPLALPWLNTAIVVLSSATLYRAIRQSQGNKSPPPASQQAWGRARVGGPWPWLVATWLLGALFLCLQTVVWLQLYEQGLLPSSGIFGSIFYGLTWVHAAHVLVGLLGVGWYVICAATRRWTIARTIQLSHWGMYWHFVTCVWGVLFVTVYLL